MPEPCSLRTSKDTLKTPTCSRFLSQGAQAEDRVQEMVAGCDGGGGVTGKKKIPEIEENDGQRWE